jgi:hypothetical protein
MLDVTVLAQDDGGFPVDVQIEISGMLQGLVVDESPAVFGATFPAGEYTIVAHGTDLWGNAAQSQSVSFTVGAGSGDGDGDESGDGDGDSGGQEESDGGEPPTSGGETGEAGFDAGADSNGGCAIAPGRRSGAWLGLWLLGLACLRRRG